MPDAFTKDPDEVLDYVRDWTALLEPGEVIVSSTWIPVPDLTIVSEYHTDTRAIVWLADGVLGKRYRLTNRITTSGGRIHDKTLTFKIREK